MQEGGFLHMASHMVFSCSERITDRHRMTQMTFVLFESFRGDFLIIDELLSSNCPDSDRATHIFVDVQADADAGSNFPVEA